MALADTETAEIVCDITPVAARELTERIKSAVEGVWRLVCYANESKAYAALGYGTFADYVKAEFGMSARHAYRLIDQAVVIREIEAAVADVTHGSHVAVSPMGDTANGDTRVHLSEREARDLKPVIDQVTSDLKDALADAALDEPGALAGAIEKVVTKHRDKAQQKADEKAKHEEDAAVVADLAEQAEQNGMDLDEKRQKQRGAFSRLCIDIGKQVSPAEFVESVGWSLNARHIAQAERAYAWLDEFLLLIKEGE